MDRASIVRDVFRPLLLAALAIQAITPDLLDYTLLSHSLPPGPVFAISRLVNPSESDSREEAFFPEGSFAVPSVASSDLAEAVATPHDLCRPFWPELAVARVRNLVSPVREKLQADWSRTTTVLVDVLSAPPSRIPLARMARLPLLLCRFLC